MTGFRGISMSLFLSINLFLHIHSLSAQSYLGYSCTGDNSTPAFKANLNTFVSTYTNYRGFGPTYYQVTIGNGVDQFNGIAYCRGDADNNYLCDQCIQAAVTNLTAAKCPNKKEAVIWYDECQFRFSNKPIYGIMALNPYFALQSSTVASNVTSFSQELTRLAGAMVAQAPVGPSRKYSALRSRNIELYGVMQCDFYISSSDCTSCLNTIAKALSQCCYSKVGARWMTPSCSFRYETYPFLVKPAT